MRFNSGYTQSKELRQGILKSIQNMALCVKYKNAGQQTAESDTTAMRKGTISDLGHSFDNPGSGVC
jgi:hypothetical protein